MRTEFTKNFQSVRQFVKILSTLKVYKACQNSWLYAPFVGYGAYIKELSETLKTDTDKMQND